ncbi:MULTISPECIES: DUF6907 domain-containing protein [Streptomyces]|uniref:Uncharacterized protein n=1 Tax=Streptomyces dengpaensis TaxID=2049881 RepID=A0ABN5I4C4_9ACTN|nr:MULTISPECIES: hypothetical protein [Streptomyces]AVH57871.1 hypothetical protein C4B68_21250 [Streptomyces dengpaensis]PIB04832.1 hypothetical protein B1C81_31285 [Streptomyces sp. HG99]
MSTEPRTATVNVLVTKPLEIEEPDWCAGAHDRAQFRPDIIHNGPETVATFDTSLGTIQYMRAWISHAPYGDLAPEPLPIIAVEIGGDALSVDPDGLRAFVATTRAHLDALDHLADEAERIRGGGQ